MRITTIFPGDSRGPGFLAWFVRCVLDGMALGAHPAFASWGLPPLYESGVRFALEPNHGTGLEEFDLPPTVYRRGTGDCDDLVLWRLLELWGDRPTLDVRRDLGRGLVPRTWCDWDGTQMHVLIVMPDGSFEDPSRKLGA